MELDGAALYQLKQRGKTRREIAEFTGLSMGAIGGRVWRYEQTLKGGAPPEKPELFNVNLGAPERLEGDWLIVSDIQAPTVDLDMARRVLPVAKLWGIKQLLLLGDLINVDWLSRYPVLVAPPTGYVEIRSARHLIEEWLTWFENIVIKPGNHEDRYLSANAGNLDMTHLVKLLTDDKRVTTSNFDHCWIDTPAGAWFATHGKHYSVHQLVVANEYAQKYQANVICGHQHHLALGWDKWKRYLLVDNGGLFAPEKMSYVSMRATKMPNMKAGFTALVGGVPTLYGEWPMTDWGAVFNQLDSIEQPLERAA